MEKRVALYCRVSTEEQKQKGLSIEAQIKRLQDYCQFKNWIVFKIYKDEGVSGSSISKRKEFQELLKESKEGKFSTILITKFDRAFRNTREALNTFDELKNNNIDFVSISEDIDTTTTMGKFFFIVISALAELERGLTIDRTKDIMRNKFDKGMMVGRSPFGYKPVKKYGKIVGFKLDKKEAEIVSDCFKLTKEWHPYSFICKKHKLKPQQYYNIIKNKVYCGYIQFEDKERKGNHPSIISEELYNEVNKKSL